MRILAVVILYFPTKEVDKNIASFRSEVDDVLVIDNTHNNRGIAASLNQALDKAIDEKYDWLLTMDQDSFFAGSALTELKSVALSADENVAWVSPFHRTAKSTNASTTQRTTALPFAMTSGSMVRITACEKAGRFEDKLFIDSVDNEYCLRLRKLGFKIIRANHSVLEHTLGSMQDHHFLLFRFQATTHNAARRYYITRNMLHVMFRYPLYFFGFGVRELVKSFVLIAFVEDKKHSKIAAMVRGLMDFVRGRYGPR